MAAQQGDNADSDIFMYVVMGIFLLAAAPMALYALFGDYLRAFFFYSTVYGLHPFAFFFDNAEHALSQLQQREWRDYSLNETWQQLQFVAAYWRWPMLLFFVVLLLINSKLYYYENVLNEVYTIQKLMRKQVKVFPAIAPVVDRDLEKEPWDSGPWMTARQPYHFVAENGLIRDGKGKVVSEDKIVNKKTGLWNARCPLLKNNSGASLDRDKARELFIEQLGDPFKTVWDLPDYQRGLAAAFMAHGFGNRDAAFDLLDQMSLSFQEEGRTVTKDRFFGLLKTKHKTDFDIDIEGADELLEKYADSEEVANAVEKHTSYVTTWFYALFLFAKRKGVLPTSEFIWLKPTDRLLFYTLNQVRDEDVFRGLPWVEAAGPWSHYLIEEMAGNPVHEPQVAPAVDGLEVTLRDSGWLPDPASDED